LKRHQPKLFLDAHISWKSVAVPLRAFGYDVRAADEERSLDRTGDESLLELATSEGRVMVTFNVEDFVPILVRWGEAGRSHAGCILVAGIDHGNFGVILRRLEELLSRTAGEPWDDLTLYVSK
jgi:Domain of unknown function (DUF5615)